MSIEGVDVTRLLLLLAPLILIQLGLFVWALVDLIKRQNVTGGKKWLWALLIILVNLIGPILYLAIGRQPDDVEE